MNIYTYTFASECPKDGEMIIYTLELKSNDMILVEGIKAHAGKNKKGYGEQIAQSFHENFPKCFVSLEAVHQGVHAKHFLG